MNPITALVTVVLALIGAALFTGGLPLPGLGFGVLAVLTLFSLNMAQLGALRDPARWQIVEREGTGAIPDHPGR